MYPRQWLKKFYSGKHAVLVNNEAVVLRPGGLTVFPHRDKTVIQ